MCSPFLGSGGCGYDSVCAIAEHAIKRNSTQLRTGATCLPLISEVYQRGTCGRTDEGFPALSINVGVDFLVEEIFVLDVAVMAEINKHTPSRNNSAGRCAIR